MHCGEGERMFRGEGEVIHYTRVHCLSFKGPDDIPSPYMVAFPNTLI
jgi:hypothetical protein